MRSSGSHGAARAGLRGLVLLAALLAAGMAQALSLGNANLQSRLGEPLRVSIPLGSLGSVGKDEIIVGRAPQADYARLGVDPAAPGTPLRFELVVDRSGNASIEVRSEQPLSEPYADLVVEVRWPTGRLVRQYTLLLELPPR